MITRQNYGERGPIANPTEPTATPSTPAVQNTANYTAQPCERQHNQLPPIYLLSDPVDPSEVWKPFPDHERRYEVSSLGRVCIHSGGFVMHPDRHPDGYACVWLPRPNSQNVRAFSVHWAVAMAFLPNPLGYPFVRHIDGNSFNNKASNLLWDGTPLASPISSLTSSTPASHE